MRDDERKIVIITGYTCNNNCRFCYDGNKKRKIRDLSLDEIKKMLIDGRRKGFSYVDFIGGETTIRSDIFDMISFAKKIGYKIINVTTNGRMFYYKKFAKRIVESGLTGTIFSIHGNTPNLHDYQTRSKGSFKQLVEGLKNLQELGIYISANVTITKLNYKFLEQIAKFLIKEGIKSAEFIFVHPFGYAYNDFDVIVPTYSEVRPYLQKALDIGIKNIATHWVARYVPFCFMQGYEKYMSEVTEPHMEHIGPDFSDTNVKEHRKENVREKLEKCKECKYDLICEGPWKEYTERRGWSEFIPIEGKKITHIYF